MKAVVRDKKFLLILLCINALTIFSIIKYMYARNEQQQNTEVCRLTAEYNKELYQRDGEVDTIKNTLQISAMQNNADDSVNDPNESEKFDVNDDKSIEKLIMNIADMINNNEFSNILALYNKDYVDEFKVDEGQIKDKFKFSPSISPKITNTKRDSNVPDRAVVTVRFIDNKNVERIFDFTIFKDGSIADIPLYKEVELNKVTEKDNVTYTLKKKFITRLGSIFIINIDNKSKYLLDIKNIQGTLGTSLKFDHELINGNIHSYEITPQKSVDLIVKIYNEEKPDDILFTIQKVDGSVETFSIWNKQ